MYAWVTCLWPGVPGSHLFYTAGADDPRKKLHVSAYLAECHRHIAGVTCWGNTQETLSAPCNRTSPTHDHKLLEAASYIF